MNKILGLHHITAIAGDAQRNYDFYTKTLGVRLVKKTVNFDDPQTYHFYFGNEVGTPGTILTFFPWTNVRQGKTGAGMATEIGYSVPKGSLDFWKVRFEKGNIRHEALSERFGEKYIAFQDPDGLWLHLIEAKQKDKRKGWETAEIKADVALKGFHTVTLTLNDIKATAAILTEVFGYKQIEREDNLYRYQTDAVENAAIVDLLEMPQAQRGVNAGGTNHHVAFRVKNEDVLYGHYTGTSKHYEKKKVGLINFDSHFDIRKPESSGVSSGTGFYQVATDCQNKGKDFLYLALGIQRSGNTTELFNRADELKAEYVLAQDFHSLNLEKMKEQVQRFLAKTDAVCLTIDLDVFSPSLAPGVSAPTAAGILYDHTFREIMKLLVNSNKVVSLDMAEYNPTYDIDSHTANLAAQLIFDWVDWRY
ncbi:MAG: hypothetical protein DHS20C13_27680 [Thermodesulfobacteriota bacterium]|nr:MAG: hypothetical protein DHS20C13_27680 [Thermodesulfobacteriota bacterium]GJM36584.1 MAG: hypothetical protein DHS20C18_55850 [Saprospiraceae bacterium]